MACCGRRTLPKGGSREVRPQVQSQVASVSCCRETSKPITTLQDGVTTFACSKCKYDITKLVLAAKPPTLSGPFTVVIKVICPNCKHVNEHVVSGG